MPDTAPTPQTPAETPAPPSPAGGGFFSGLLLLAGGIALIVWGEHRMKQKAGLLDFIAQNAITADAARVDPAREGKPVYLTGRLESVETLSDPDFGVAVQALRLRRDVEMFQWVEKKRETPASAPAGGTNPPPSAYTYRLEWADEPVSSADFHEHTGHDNPPMLFPSYERSVQTATLGAFTLAPALLDRLGVFEPYPVASTDAVAQVIRPLTSVLSGGFYVGKNPLAPALGDLKVRFSAVPQGPVSLIANQRGARLEPCASAGAKVELIKAGVVPKEALVQMGQTRNTRTAWLFRIGGGLLALIGVGTILKRVKGT